MHPKDGSGKEKEVHQVLLDPNASEYKKVAEDVRKTCTVNIIKIERVQNPVLYRQYMVRRDQMEHKKVAMKNYSSMEQREAAAPPSTNSVSTEATVAKMVIIKFIVILEVYTYMIFFLHFL